MIFNFHYAQSKVNYSDHIKDEIIRDWIYDYGYSKFGYLYKHINIKIFKNII